MTTLHAAWDALVIAALILLAAAGAVLELTEVLRRRTRRPLDWRTDPGWEWVRQPRHVHPLARCVLCHHDASETPCDCYCHQLKESEQC